MKHLAKIFTVSVINLFLVLEIRCVPISDYKKAIEYLKTFEYLSSNENNLLSNIVDNHENIENDKRFKRALKNLQRNGNIPITGELDDTTLKLLERPRCGVSDKILNVKRHKRYTLMSSKWSKTDLTWSYSPKKNDPFVKDEKSIRRIIGEALSVWEQDTIMKFKQVELKDNPDIIVSFENRSHTDVDPYPFGSQTLAHAFQPGPKLGGDAHFNVEIKWDFDVSFDSRPRDGMISFYAVALHELGHSLGLGHTRDESAVMYEFYSKSTATLAEDDIRGMQFIYGVPPNKKYKPPPKAEESDEDMPVWAKEPTIDKCNTSYDAIAFINKELFIFKENYVFGPTYEVVEIHKVFKELPKTVKYVNAAYETEGNDVMFFVGTHVYIISKGKQQFLKQTTLQNMGLANDIRKVDAVFRWAYMNQKPRTFIFSDDFYWILDETTLKVTRSEPNRITKVFRDVYDIDTALVDKDGQLIFFHNENYYEFDINTLRMKRMKPALSANKFMNCQIQNPYMKIDNRFGDDIDYIDEGPVEQEKSSPPIFDEKDDARSIQSVMYLICVLAASHLLI